MPLDAPLQNLPKLYQLWGTLQVILALLRVAAERNYVVEDRRLLRQGSQGFYVRVLPDGAAALVLRHPVRNIAIRLIPERTYGHGLGLHSVSYEQRPDIAVEVTLAGQPRAVYLFDPKYKLTDDIGADSLPKKEDIDKMHAYRDAIRDAAGQHIVAYAAILYPGTATKEYDPGIAALSAIPGDTTLQDRLIAILTRLLADVAVMAR